MIIEIAGQQWSVQAVEAHDPGLFANGDECRGTCWCGKSEIYLSKELSGDQVPRVVMHELVHAYIYATQAVKPENWTEEDMCELIAIYGWQMCVLGRQICEELFPKVKLRPWNITYGEVRV